MLNNFQNYKITMKLCNKFKAKKVLIINKSYSNNDNIQS